jgi:uncharacterized protein (DUF2147 family)
MKKCLAIAALLLASTVGAAQAQYSFEYNGRTITIDPDRGTVSIPGVYDNTGKKKRQRGEEGDLDRPTRKVPQQAKTAPQAAPEPTAPAAPAPAEQAATPAAPTAPAPSAPAAATAAPSTATAAVAPADTAAPAPPAVPAAPAPPVEAAVPTTPPAPAPLPPQQKQAAAPATSTPAASNSPVGIWLTEEKEGKVRIEQCGPNLCGYAVDKKSNQNGEQVLINMKPGKDKWSGRILDPNSGSTYDSTIALKGDTLRVQGCAFGGMFCGGQTWTRVN